MVNEIYRTVMHATARETLSKADPDLNRGEGSLWDVAVIGGGVVGCAVARRLTLLGARLLLLEAAPDILSGASKGNSALLHTGFDAPTGSLELRLMREGYREYLEIRDRLNLPLLKTGALVVAWTDAEADRLDGIAATAIRNGVEDVERLTPAQVRAREPGLSERQKGALLVPGEAVIDPWSAPLAYLTQAVLHGADVWFGAKLLAGRFEGEAWRLQTTRGPASARHVVNCAGLFGDEIERRCLGEASFEIRPRKGQFVVFDKAAAAHVTRIILPTPTERTKGVVVTRTIFGNVLVGPTAEDQASRDLATVDRETLQGLIDRAAEMVPALGEAPVTAVYAGLRPASETKAYRIRHEPHRHWITLGAVRSTGLTAALGLAAHAAELIGAGAWRAPAVAEPVWPKVPNLAEHAPRDWRAPGYGEIICHCEMVTRREIEAAFASPVPPGDLGGLRRRTRVAMGRCQGFYCGAKLARITAGRLAAPLATALADG